MKKLLIIMLAVLTLTGCGDTYESSAEKLSEAYTQDEVLAAEQSDTLEETPDTIKRGVWLSVQYENDGSRRDSFYQFNGDGTGKLVYQETGKTDEFTYELNDDNRHISFNIGGGAEFKEADITYDYDDPYYDKIRLSFSDGKSAELTLRDEQTIDELDFYSNEELCEMAKAYKYLYLEGTSDFIDDMRANAVIKDNGMIEINVSYMTRDKYVDYNTYLVDRYSAEGKDRNGSAVDLKTALEDHTGSGGIRSGDAKTGR